MQFKHPELLWALLLLLIPIVIHLFQLRRFKKTSFTNVQFLQKVVSESRRSNSLKKWLLLLTRMLLLAALVIGFAQPFWAGKSAFKEKETVIYLDDSFSMQAKAENGTLLNAAIQSLVQYLPKANKFSLFTNTKVFKDVVLAEVQNDLLSLKANAEQLSIDEVKLKANSIFNSSEGTVNNLIIISDFQQRFAAQAFDTLSNASTFFVRLIPKSLANVSLDSTYLKNRNENPELSVLLTATDEMETIPVSLFNGDQLIAKTAAVFDTNKKAKLNFTLPKNELIKGKLEITDNGLQYDNHLYFSVNKENKIKVLTIGNESDEYLKRIFTDDEFEYKSTSLKNLDYNQLAIQNLVVLNEISSIPTALNTSLKSFTDNGGAVVIVPSSSIDLIAYNSLMNNYFRTSYTRKINYGRNITNISFSHPLYQNVFEKKIANFQYPEVASYYGIKTNAPSLLSFQDKEAFMVGSDKVFIFSAPISIQNSNFKNSPLIVPTFYNIGKSSLQLPDLYTVMGQNSTVDIATTLTSESILKAVKSDYEFIPQQRSFSNRVQLSFDQNPEEDGIYEIKDGERKLQDLSFNQKRKESELVYLNIKKMENMVVSSSISSLFASIAKDSSVNELWRWFVSLALVFMLMELLIQKYS